MWVYNMCLIITLLAAVVSTLIWYFNSNRKHLKLGTLTLMYWSASLMWTVDGIFCIANGEPFLDLSGNDALLGLVVVLCGTAAWALMLVTRNIKIAVASKK